MEGIYDDFEEGNEGINDLISAGREMNYQTTSNFEYSTYLCTDIIKVVVYCYLHNMMMCPLTDWLQTRQTPPLAAHCVNTHCEQLVKTTGGWQGTEITIELSECHYLLSSIVLSGQFLYASCYNYEILIINRPSSTIIFFNCF